MSWRKNKKEFVRKKVRPSDIATFVKKTAKEVGIEGLELERIVIKKVSRKK